MDLELVKKKFDEYVSNYDRTNKDINYKIIHSYKVMELMKDLAIRLNLDDKEVVVAQIIGLLHDIGRFEQINKFNKVLDVGTCDHADESCKYLFDEGHIRDFIIDDSYDKEICHAIKNHNKKEMKEDYLFSKMIRDMDKVDIYRVEAINYDFCFNAEEITDEVIKEFSDKKLVTNENIKSDSDQTIGALALIFDINFDESFDILAETDNFSLFVSTINVDKGSQRLFDKLKEICIDKINEGVKIC